MRNAEQTCLPAGRRKTITQNPAKAGRNWKWFYLLPCYLITLLPVFNGCSKKSEKVLAKVGGEKITVEEFEKLLASESFALREYLSTDIGRRQYLDAIIKEKIALIAAKKEGVQNRPAVKEQFAELDKRLKENYKRLKDKILTDAIIEEKIVLGDSDVENYYKQHKQEFEKPTSLKVSHILLGTKGDAENALARINKGENFAKLAGELSIDKITASKGGDLGFFGRREYVKEFEDEAYKLKNVGDISGVVETPLGYHIIKLAGRKQLNPQKLEDVEMQIRRLLQKEKIDKWIDDVSKKYKPEINQKLLEDIVKGQPPMVMEQEKK